MRGDSEEVPDLAEFIRWIEDAMNDPSIPVGYCSWPECPICRERGLVPDEDEQ